MKYMTANEVLENVRKGIEELESINGLFSCEIPEYDPKRYCRISWRGKRYAFRIRAVCKEFEIFDWWNENLSVNQLKQMETFLKQAIGLGFTGYVCFKVGAIGCANGMWAYKKESTNGYSPDGDFIYHSFVSNENVFALDIGGEHTYGLNLKQVKEILKSA